MRGQTDTQLRGSLARVGALLLVGGLFTLGLVSGANVSIDALSGGFARTSDAARNLALPATGAIAPSSTPSSSAVATHTPTPLAATPAVLPLSSPGNVTIAILNRGSGYGYVPASLSIPTGTTVHWVNNSTAPHTVTGFGVDSGLIAVGAQFSYTFATPGTFSYVCTFHPGMTGALLVYTPTNAVAPTPPAVPTVGVPPAPPIVPPAPPPPGVVAVSIVQGADFAFSPATLTIPAGTTVRWTNNTGAPHTVTAQGVFDSGVIPAGGTFSRLFNQAGTFAYLCSIHPNMTGTITVTSATLPPAPTPTASALAQVSLIKVDGNYSFAPAAVSIRVGTTVTWVNTTGDALTVDGVDFQSPLLPKEGGTWSHVFTTVGTFSYTSRVRPEMTGTITVTP